MRCEDILAALTDYVDGQLDAETTAAIQAHLEKCPACELVVDNIRKTISVYCSDRSIEMPLALQEHLDSLLRDHWKAKFS